MCKSRGLLDPRNTWTCRNDAWAYWIQIDRRKSTIHERSVRTERQEGLLTDRLTIDFFCLEKDGTFFLSVFFFHTSAAALYLLSLMSVKQSHIVGMKIFLRCSYTTLMALESSQLAELKYAILAAWDIKKLPLSIGHTWTKLFLARRAYCRKAKSWGQIIRLNIHEEHLKERTGVLRLFERANSKDRPSTKRVNIFPLTEG